MENESEADKLVEIDLSDDECEISQNIQEEIDKVEGESSNEVTRDESTEINTVYDVPIEKGANRITMGCGSILLRPKNSITNLVLLREKLWKVNGYTNEKSRLMDQLRDLSQDWLLKASHKKLDKTMMKCSVQLSGLNPFAQSLQWQFKMR